MKPISGPRRRWWRPAALAAACGLAAALWLSLRPRAPSPIPREALSLGAVERARGGPAGQSPPQLPADDGPDLVASDVAAGAAAPRPHHPRDPEEWQGMLVRTDAVPPCEESATCGLARACKAGKCVACSADGDCAGGEVCVLDHCVVRELAGCRSRTDCAAGNLCVLSGYSSEARGNEGMRSLCLDPGKGSSAMPAPEPAPPDPRTRLPDDDLLEQAAEAARSN